MTTVRCSVRLLAGVCLAVWVCLTQAQPVPKPKDEVSVEWDFSRRSAINSTPFTRSTFPGGVQPDARDALKPSPGSDQADLAERQWTVEFSDGTVRRMLQRWADDAGYQLLWDVPRDFPIEVEMSMRGRFRDVVWTVIESLSVTDFPVQASINPHVRSIRVVRYLDSQAR